VKSRDKVRHSLVVRGGADGKEAMSGGRQAQRRGMFTSKEKEHVARAERNQNRTKTNLETAYMDNERNHTVMENHSLPCLIKRKKRVETEETSKDEQKGLGDCQ
jgi:hypothetical protein